MNIDGHGETNYYFTRFKLVEELINEEVIKMNDIKNLAVGKRFKFEDIEYEVFLEEAGCSGCDFDERPCGVLRERGKIPNCGILTREDKRSLIFKKVKSNKQEKEDVLKIEITKINEEYSAFTIVYQNEDVLKRGEFEDDKIRVCSSSYPHYDYEKGAWLYIRGTNEKEDNKPISIKNEHISYLLERVKLLNEKYGIQKRWRAEKGGVYYVIAILGDIASLIENNTKFEEKLYRIGNYFQTEEEAEQKLKEIKNLLRGE